MTVSATAAPVPDIAGHYDTGPILQRIRDGLAAAGADPDRPRPADLKGVDEFHIGGVEATEALLDQVRIGPESRVIDLGSGIGGTARFVAERYGARVTGIDLTPAFVEVAGQLSAMCGLGDRTAFVVGSVLDLPMADGSADVVTMIHVGMNVADKKRLMAEAARVLAPGGRFGLFDIMRRTDADPEFPVPWASTVAQSALDWPEVYRDAAAAAGLRLLAERDRHAYAVDYFRKVMAAMQEAGGPPPVSLPLIMGETAQVRYGNIVAATLEGRVGPWEMIFERPA